MKLFVKYVPSFVAYFYILLFCYAAISKVIDFENFQIQIAQSPILSAYANFTSYAVIIAELYIVFLLVIPSYRLFGLYASFGIMCAFTVYIYLILNYSDFIPCSCGGILEKMGWTEHLIFNIGCALSAFIASLFLESGQEANKPQYKETIMRRGIISLSIGVISSIIVISLFYSSEEIIKKENNFTRRFLQHPLTDERSINLGVDSYYIAGITNNDIFLANHTSPFHLLKIDLSLNKKTVISVVPDDKMRFRSLTYTIANNQFYAYDGTIPILFEGKELSNNINWKTISHKDAFFNQMVVLDTSKFAIRTNDRKTGKEILGILSPNQSSTIKLNKNMISNKHTGPFESDGKLLFDKSSNHIYYMFYYNNKILKLDENLNLVLQGKTIDTTTVAKIKTKKTENGYIKMSEPPKMVNRVMTIHKGIIFNRSNLIGRNENKKHWKTNSIIDLYDTKIMSYVGSFYIHHRESYSVQHMLVTDKYLFVLVGNELVRYRIAQTITQQFNKGNTENPIKE